MEIKELKNLREMKINALDTISGRLTSVGDRTYKMMLDYQPIIRRFTETLQAMSLLLETYVQAGGKMKRESRIMDLNVGTLFNSMTRAHDEIREHVQDIATLLAPYFDQVQPLMQEANKAGDILAKPYPVIPYKSRMVAETEQGQLLEKRYRPGEIDPAMMAMWRKKRW